MNHLYWFLSFSFVCQAKREEARSAALPHSVSIEETKNSIPFISSPSPIRGSSSYLSSPLQLHLDGEATEDTKDSISHIESRSPKTFVRPLFGCKASAQGH